MHEALLTLLRSRVACGFYHHPELIDALARQMASYGCVDSPHLGSVRLHRLEVIQNTRG